MVRFDGSESKYEQEIEHVTQDITDEFRSAEKGLRRMAQSDRNGEFSAADAKTRQNVQRALATQLQTLSGDFRKSQKTYLARVKNQKEGPLWLTLERAVALLQGFTQAQVTEVEIAEDVINERDQEIQRIATSITELATIFKELAVLVIDQGTILDRIDYNMEQVVEQTEKGIEELEKAEQTQKNSRPMKCIGLLLIMIFIMTVLLVLKHSWKTGANLCRVVDAVSKDVLMWGYRGYTRVLVDEEIRREETTNELLGIVQALLQLLSLPQFQPILLPKYVVELLALLVYGEVAMDTETLTPVQTEFIRLREMVLKVLPLKMTMSSLRAALGQAKPVANEQAVGQRFKARCGNLLSRLLMEDGGIVATIEMLLGGVEEGNTQARMQVATLICQRPSGEDPNKYATALCTQVRELLLAAVTPEKGNTSSKLLGEMAALLADQLATRHPGLFDAQILSVLFHPLLIYEDSRLNANTPIGDTSEEAITHSVSIARLLLCGPPPSQRFLKALAPLVRPLLHMYAFAATSKSFLAAPLRELLTAWIRSCSNATLLLQVAVLPVTLPLQTTLTVCGYERKHDQESWRPLRQFCAGGEGGISLRPVQVPTSLAGDEEDVTEPLKALIIPVVELLGAKELESSEVVGDLFSSLLLTYMHVRKHGEADTVNFSVKAEDESSPLALYEPLKSPTSAEGVEIVLMLLLALIECLGPSVLRSASTVLHCIGTVLETYNMPTTKIVDKEQQSESIAHADPAENEEGDEILTVCLGVVMTILEAGSSHRSDSEEQQLRAMLPVLEILSRHSRAEVAELASNARAQILSRGASTESTNNSRAGEQSFEEVLREAEQDLSSQLVPLRARGVVTLTKLVRRSHSHSHDEEWTPRIHALASVFLLQLHDSESYVFLAAVQGLAALADAHPDVAIPALVKALRDSNNSLESRIKLSEALLFSAKRCGETLPKYAKLFVYAYLECIRPPPSHRKNAERMQREASKRVQLIQEVQAPEELAADSKDEELVGNTQMSEAELLAAATLRASCLSNLAEVCALLHWGLQPFLLDVLTCVFGVLQLELELEAKRRPKSATSDAMEDDEHQKLQRHYDEEQQQRVVAVRRGAVFVLRYLVELLGWKMLELMPDQLSPLVTPPKVEALDVDEGRTRKISAKWRQKQQETHIRHQFDDGIWPQAAGTEMHLGFNAFDFSASPEAFYDEPEEPLDTDQILFEANNHEIFEPGLSIDVKSMTSEKEVQQTRKEHMAEVAKQVTSMGFNSASLWERRFPGLCQPRGPIQQLPTFTPNSLWGGPVHYATYDDQRRALYYQPPRNYA
ncbi:unnamed protein product [Phytophthora lilii]|uniref:Unnamed protein product n=1 Tax=Phytophthora lilii TaxID=2077276 RepID=A0A9W6YI78_9STRA|nr:unnamed protein product [Phytophthora lilii]